MINILDKNSIKGKTVYVVYRSGREIPATVVVHTYTNCRFAKYSCKPYGNGMVNINCAIHGIDEKGFESYVRGYNGVVNTNEEQDIFDDLFISKDEAIERREEILNEIEKDIESYIIASRDKIEASKAILANVRRNNLLLSEKELLELATSAAE